LACNSPTSFQVQLGKSAIREQRVLRFLFCLPTTALSGGVKVAFEIINRLVATGEEVDVFSFAGPPKWTELKGTLLPAKDIEEIGMDRYDFVLVTNAFFLPMVLPRAGRARVVFFCQDYECFHHSPDKSYEGFMAECPTFAKLYLLPVPIISISRAVQGLIKERLGKDSYYVPMGLNKSVFNLRPRKVRTELKRVLMVGNYLMPYKGMRDGFAALERLSQELDVQLVLVTQEHRNRKLFDNYSFPVELHYCPTEERMPEIIASCDTYCCTSWYEGLGLPALEAFCCGVPVVSTRTYGVSDYGLDGVNLLLARPNDPSDFYEKLRALLRDEALAESLRSAAFKTVAHDYAWDTSLARFRQAIDEIKRTYAGPGPIDPAYMRALLDELEREGNLTPIATYRRFRALAAELTDLCRKLLSGRIAPNQFAARLASVRDGFRQYLNNKRAEYYDVFKAKYDLCQLILSLREAEQFRQYLSLIMAGRRESGGANSASFVEIRYSDRESANRAVG
jgi:glycosyltransferase involved in cell wall biosynthesis